MINPNRLRRFKLSLLFLVLTLGALAYAWRAEPAGLAAGRARPLNRIPLADVSPWGANFFLDLEVERWSQEKTAREARAAGIRWAKQMIPWYDVEPEAGAFRWEKYDRIVDVYRAEGMDVIFRLDFAPDWVVKPEDVPAEKRGLPNNVPPADFGRFAEYAAKVADHFRGRVGFYQIWNEPNLTQEWGYRRVDPEGYAELLKAAADAIRAADPDAVVLTAPLAINDEEVDLGGNLSDLAYLRGLLAAGEETLDSFDVLSVNAFGMEAAPDAEPGAKTLNFRRVELQRAEMARAGADCKPVWAAEYGWNSAPPEVSSMWGQVSQDRQAQWTVEGVRYAQERWPWAGVFNIWYFRHCCKSPRDPVYHFQLLDEAFSPRRVYAGVRATASQPAVATAGYWAERSAPVELADPEDWRWRWDAPPGERACRGRADNPSAADDHRYLESVGPEAELGFTFRGTDLAARVREGPQAGSIAWRVDGADSSPRLSLKSGVGWRWVPLATGLDPGVHRLDIALGAAGGSLAIDGFRVDEAAGGGGWGRWRLLAGGLAAFFLALTLVDGRHLVRRLPTGV